MWAPLTGAPGARWRRDTSLMTEIGNSVERVRAALQKAGHPDTTEVFADGTRTAEEAAAAVSCTVAQIAKSIVLRAGDQVVLVMTSGVNRVDVGKISRALGVKAKAADGRWCATRPDSQLAAWPPSATWDARGYLSMWI
jgi:hypothetical protein